MLSRSDNWDSSFSRFEILREKTRNFSCLVPEIILNDPSCLEVFRTLLGMTINSFSKAINFSQTRVYNVEKGNDKLGIKGAENLASRISPLLKNIQLNMEEIKINYYSLNNIVVKSDVGLVMTGLVKYNFRQFFEFVKKLQNITFNFSQLYGVILTDSRIFLVFRLILGLSQKEFAKKLNICKTTVVELENGYRRIQLPSTAKHYALKVEKYLKSFNLEENHLERKWYSWKNTRIIKNPRFDSYNWKTIRYINQKEFGILLKQIRDVTNNFSDIPISLLQKDPRLILIFRAILGITQRDLERKLKLRGISHYECLKYKTLSLGKAELFSKYFEFEINSGKLYELTNDEILLRFLDVKEAMFAHRSNGFAHSFTTQEQKVLHILESLNISNLRILAHKDVHTSKGLLNVDFIITLGDRILFAIECTNTQAISKKFSYNIKRKIYEIDYRFTKLKADYPLIKTVLWLSVYDDELVVHRLRNLVKAQTLSVDNTFINGDLENLSKLIMEDKNIQR